MYRVIECLVFEHSWSLVLLAALVCILGSCVSVLTTRRLRRTQGRRKHVQLILSSLITGATIWATHFIAMLAYDPGVTHGYEPGLTAASLAVGVLGVLIANMVYGVTKRGWTPALAGMIFGLTVTTMHYTGMRAYQIPGTLTWDTSLIVASVLLGAALGAAAYHVNALKRRGGWLWAALLLVLAICAMHFTGMGAITLSLSAIVMVPEQALQDGTLVWLVFTVASLILFVGFAALSIETDVERDALRKLEYSVTHDPLTGLANRAGLIETLDLYRDRIQEDEATRVAVLTIDLDLFKEINDLHGHAAGDTILRTIAARLDATCTGAEFIARTGGDEFVAVKGGFRRLDEVDAFANRLHTLIVEPIETPAFSATLGASIGIATTVKDGTDMEALLHKSDQAMYRAKSDVDTAICTYNTAMGAHTRERLMLVHDLRKAVAEDQFELVYQLQNDITSLAPTGFEVLIRWRHPKRGLIPPDMFIPVAEETGLIREIGLWVLRTACAEAASWEEQLSIAVNVAPKQLAQPSFTTHLSEILQSTGLDPRRLELEVTEASIIDDQDFTLNVMHQIKDMGVRIAMDDFGTGYSSLATLQAFPFDKIKIDRSFVQGVHTNPQRAAIVRSTLLLGDALGIPVLAEGVEFQDDLSFLQAEKCASVQGFYFGKPLSRDDMRAMIRKPLQSRAS